MVKNSLPNSGGPEVEETPQCLKKKYTWEKGRFMVLIHSINKCKVQMIRKHQRKSKQVQKG